MPRKKSRVLDGIKKGPAPKPEPTPAPKPEPEIRLGSDWPKASRRRG